jgi:hypothetical protein
MRLPIATKTVKFVKVAYADSALERYSEKLNDACQSDGIHSLESAVGAWS